MRHWALRRASGAYLAFFADFLRRFHPRLEPNLDWSPLKVRKHVGYRLFRTAQKLAAAHNDQAVKTQLLVFLSRGRDVY
jgi:hypothetical protein